MKGHLNMVRARCCSSASDSGLEGVLLVLDRHYRVLETSKSTSAMGKFLPGFNNAVWFESWALSRFLPLRHTVLRANSGAQWRCI